MKTLLPKEVGKCFRLCPWVSGPSSWAPLISPQTSCNSRAADLSTQSFYCVGRGKRRRVQVTWRRGSERFHLLLPLLHKLRLPLPCSVCILDSLPPRPPRPFPAWLTPLVCLSHLLENMSSSFLFSSLPPPPILIASHDK